MRNVKASSYAAFFALLTLTCYLSYAVERYETLVMLGCFAALFAVYAAIVSTQDEINFWLTASVILRISLLLALPKLSDDFYRFIWDGRLWTEGHHPFSALPGDFLGQHIPGLDAALFERLNSKEYYTIYPPVAQLIFWLSAKASPSSILGSVVIMRVFVILAEVGNLLLMQKLLERFSLPRKNVLLYALNPFIILELAGNLHLEVFVIFFLLLSILWLSGDKLHGSAIAFGFAVGVKLLPLIFLPLLPAFVGIRKAIFYSGTVALTCFVLFIPLYDQQIFAGFADSFSLYFQKFEFNASLYYLVREYGFWRFGYNTIQTSGWKLAVASAALMGVYSLMTWFTRNASKDKNSNLMNDWATAAIFTLFIYLAFATTVHPWYITPLAAFSIFTRFRFAIMWTAVILITYSGYSKNGFSENLWVVAIEYLAVYGYLAYELCGKREPAT